MSRHNITPPAGELIDSPPWSDAEATAAGCCCKTGSNDCSTVIAYPTPPYDYPCGIDPSPCNPPGGCGPPYDGNPRNECCFDPCPSSEFCNKALTAYNGYLAAHPFYFVTLGSSQIVVCLNDNDGHGCAWGATVNFEWSYSPDFSTIDGDRSASISWPEHGVNELDEHNCVVPGHFCAGRKCDCFIDLTEETAPRYWRGVAQFTGCDCGDTLTISVCPGTYYGEGECPNCVDAVADCRTWATPLVCCQGDGHCIAGISSCQCAALHGFVSTAANCAEAQCAGACCIQKEGELSSCLDANTNYCDPIPIEGEHPLIHDRRIGKYDCEQLEGDGWTATWTPGATCCDVSCLNCGCHNLRFNPGSFSANGLFVCSCINGYLEVELLPGGYEGLSPDDEAPCSYSGQMGIVRLTGHAVFGGMPLDCSTSVTQVTDCRLEMILNISDCIITWSLSTVDCGGEGGGGDIIGGGTVTGQECGDPYASSCLQTNPDCNALDTDLNPLGIDCGVIHFNFSDATATPCF